VTLLGTWLGHYEIVAKNIDVIAVVMVLVSVVPWGIQFLKRRRQNRGDAAADPAADPGEDLADDLPAEGMARENS
jgi:membrane-associated protein